MKTTRLSRWAALGALLTATGFVSTRSANADTVLTEALGISGFDLHGAGGLWWRNDAKCSGEFVRDGAIRVRAGTIYFGTKNLARNCAILQTAYDNVVRDEAYVYYFSNRQLYRKALSATEGAAGSVFATPPHSPTLPSGQEGTYLELADGRLWFGRYRTDIDRIDIFSIKTDGSESLQSVVSISSAGAPIRKMQWFSYSTAGGQKDALAILLANGKLYRHRIVGGNELLWVRVTDFSIHRRLTLPIPATYIYASEGTIPGIGSLSPSTQAGHLFMINADSGSVVSIYTAPNRNQILSVAAYGNSGLGSTPTRIFLTEAAVSCGSLGCDFGNVSITASPLTLFGSWGTIVFSGAGGNLRNDRDYLFYMTANTIERISLDAPPIQFDIQALGLEAGHTIQDMNSTVSLPAQKGGIYVRGYAHVPTNTTGQSPFFPSARLRVRVNGQEIADSPFSPVNNTMIDSTNDMATLRGSLNRSFLFLVPGLPPGSLTMTMTVNPNGTLPETDYANNSVSLAQPIDLLDSIGVCVRMIPMPTGMGTYDPNTPGFWDVITRADSLLPARYLTVELQPWIYGDEVFFTEPFDFGDEDEEQDSDALEKIECIREQTSSEGASEFCRFRHWVGMIHPGVANFAGLGDRPGFSLIAKMRGAGDGFTNSDSPLGGRILAHEMSHNYGRRHVDCGGPDDPDPSYPFNPCTLDDGNGNGFWGLDLLTRTIINPTNRGDLMSYAGQRWPSSYTWEGNLGTYATLFSFSAGASALTLQKAAVGGRSNLVLFVNGYIRPKTTTAVFRTFFQLPADAADAGNLKRDFAESLAETDKPDPYFIRLLDADGKELSRTALPVVVLSDGPGRRLPFAHWIRFASNTRRVQLIQKNIVLAERIVSPRPPELQVNAPIVDLAAQKVRLTWSASDPDGDALLFNVHYSRDDGANWHLVANNYRGLAATLDTRSLAGSDKARLRVTASDGVNSTYGVTAPFVLSKNPPRPFISGVQEGQRLDFGQATQLFGAALDPEQDSRSVLLNWNLVGPTPRVGTNAVLSLIGLSPGAYEATLTATDADGLSAQALRNFEVLPLVIPDGPAPTLDGFCRDRAYTNAAFVQLPLGNGNFVSVRLIHSGTDLFVSFTDLQSLATGGGVRRAGLRVDVNASGDPAALPGDRGFFIDSTGIPSQKVGNGADMIVTSSPLPGFTAVLGAGNNAWSAEFRIADSLLGGWNHAVRIMFDHDAPHWPPAANDHQPATWALAYLGAAPPPPTNRPPVAHAGSDQLINMTSARSIILDGSASHDPDGEALTFRWSQIAGPGVTLSNTTQPDARLVIPPVTNTTSLRFQLIVNDGKVPSSPSEVEITLVPAPRLPVGQMPVTPPVRHDWRGTVSGNWSEPLNWSPATVPGVEDPLFFQGLNGVRRVMTNDLPPRAVGNITFQGDNFDLYGNAIILGSQLGGSNITSLSGAVSNTLHLDIVLAGPVTINAVGNFATKTLTLLGDISLGSHRLTFVTDGDAICSGAISGTGGISKSDRGRLVLSGSSANTYSGATVVTEGTLELSKSGVISVPGDLQIGISANSSAKSTAAYGGPNQIADDAAVFVLRTGELILNNYTDTIGRAELSGGNIITGLGTLTVNRDIVCAPGDVNGSAISGRLNLGGPTTLIDVQANALLAVSAQISGGPANTEVRKAGLGELQLRTNNIYTARTRVTDGTLRVMASGGLGGGSNDVLVEGGKLVLVTSTIDGKKLVASEPGTIATEGQASIWNGPMNLAGAVNIDTVVNSSLLCSGQVDGTGGFRKTSAGLLRFEGTDANTFLGGATILQGTLELAKTSTGPAVVAIPGPLTVGDATPTPGRAVIRYINPDQIADDAQVVAARSGQVIMRDRSDLIGSLSGAGQVQLGAATLTVGGTSVLLPAVLTAFDGVISGTGRLVKTGPGILALAGINTYTGGTIVGQGTLLVHGQLSASGLVQVLADCTLGGNGQVGDVSVAASGRVAPGASPGKLTVNNVQLTTGTLDIELNENPVGTGYDQFTARGNVTLGGALAVSLGFVPAIGDSFVILNKTSSGMVSGRFNGLAEGATLSVKGVPFQITYTGGNGNDVVLTRSASKPSTISFGLGHTALGLATLIAGPSGNLIVGNIGLSGEDGVHITLGEAQGWQGQLTALDPSTGQGRLNWEIQGQRGNTPLQWISRGSMEVVNGEIRALADSSAVGATAHWVEVFAGREFLKNALVPSNAPLFRLLPPFNKPLTPSLSPSEGERVPEGRVRGQLAHLSQISSPSANKGLAMTLRYEGPFPGKPYWTCDISWPEPCRIVVPGADDSPLEGVTRVRLTPWATRGLATVAPPSALRLTGKNIQEIRISDEALLHPPTPADAGLPHRALGQAQFEPAPNDGQPVPEGGHIIVSNIGSTGADGVSIEVGDRASGIGMLTAPVSLTPAGTAITLAAVGTFGGVPGTSMGTATLRTVGAAVQATGDFTSVGSTAVRVEVFLGTELVGSAKAPAGVVVTMASATGQGGLPSLEAVGLVPAVLPGLDGIEQTAFEPLPCYFFAFDRATVFTTRAGERFVGDRLRLLTANDQPRVQSLARFEVRAALVAPASSLTLILEKLRLPAPEITRVFPPSARSGELVEILGRGFGDDPNDLSVVGSARIAGLDQFTVPFRVLSASDTRILARVGTVPPGTPSGPIQVYRGVGNEGTPQGLSSDIEFVAPIRAWREATPSGSSGNVTAYQPARILPPEQCFESGPPVDGTLSLYLYDWRSNAVVSFSSHVTASMVAGGASLDASGVRFAGGGDVLDGAKRLANVLEAAFAQQAGLIVKVQASATTDPGIAKLTLSLPSGSITRGFLNVCIRASQSVLTVANVSPLRAAEGNLITINGQGFGDDTRDLLVGARDTNGARLIPLQLLRAIDTQILARMGAMPPGFKQGPLEVRRGEGSRVASKAQAGGLHEVWRDGNAVAVSTSELGVAFTGLTACYYSTNNTFLLPYQLDSYRPPVLVLPTATWPSSVEVTINAVVLTVIPTLFENYYVRAGYETTINLPIGGSSVQNLTQIIQALKDAVAQNGFCLSISTLAAPGGGYTMTPYFAFGEPCVPGVMGEFSIWVRAAPDKGQITQVTTTGNSMTIRGSGFGGQSEDLSVAILDGGGARLIPLDVLAASDTEITARTGAVPPDALTGPIMVTRGKGSFNAPQPFFDDATIGSSVRTWRGRGTSIVSMQKVTPEPTQPETGRRWFFSRAPGNGELSVLLDGDWPNDAFVSISAAIHDARTGAASELDVPAVRLMGEGKLLDRAERIADVIRSGFWQQAALPVDVKVTSLPGGQVKLSLSLLDGFIDRGSLAISIIDPPMITAVPTRRGGPGDVVTITGRGFGTNPDNLLVYVQGSNGVPTLLRVLSATDTEIVATVGNVSPEAQPGSIVVARGDGSRFLKAVPGITGMGLQQFFPAGDVFTRSNEPFDPIKPTPSFNTACFYSVATNGVVCVEVEGDWPTNVRVDLQFIFYPDGPPPGGVYGTPLTGYIDLPGGAAQQCAAAICSVFDGMLTIFPIGTLHCAVTQTGPSRFKLTFSGDIPINGFFNLCYNKPILFLGLGAYAAGPRARIEPVGGGHLSVTNIGASGLDGMRWDLGVSQGLLWDLRIPENMPGGARLVLEASGKVAGQVALLNRAVFEWIGADLRITPDLSLLGATHYQRRLLLKGTVVHQQSGLTGVAALVRKPPPLIQPSYYLNPMGSSFRFAEALTIDLGGGITVVADTLELVYENAAVKPEYMSSIAILGANVSEFSLEQSRLLMFPKTELIAQPYLALGQAQFDARGDRLIVSNIGSRGGDGVSIDFDELGQTFLVPAVRNYKASLAPLSLPTGGEFKVSATGLLGGAKRALLGEAGVRKPNGTLEIFADFSPVDSRRLTVEVYNQGQLVGTRPLDGGGRVATLINAAGPRPQRSDVGGAQHLLTEVGNTSLSPLGLLLGFDHAGTFELTDGSKFVGNEIRLLASNGSRVSESLSSLDLVGMGFETFTIRSETASPSRLSIRLVNGNVEVSWTGVGTLEAAIDPAGPWQEVTPAPALNPHSEPASVKTKFYRLRQ